MKKHKNKIIAAVVIVALLAGAWFIGGDFSSNTATGGEQGSQLAASNDENPYEIAGDAVSYGSLTDLQEPDLSDDLTAEEPEFSPSDYENPGYYDIYYDAAYNKDIPAVEYIPEPEPLSQDPQSDSEVLEQEDPQQSAQPPETPQPEQAPQPTPPAESAPSEPVQGSAPPAAAAGERPAPVEPQDVTVTDESFTVYLTVRVDNILNNMHRLSPEKHELVPADGVIFPLTAVTAYEGESVFNVLQREMRRNRIHMESRFTPIFNSAYVMGINNLYEFDVGELSGWMYRVNGWFPNFGASRYMLSPGDIIEWHFTVDLGRDLGEFSLGGRQDG